MVGVTSTSIIGSKIDGYPLISKKDIVNQTFDILIITSMQYFEEIRQEAISLGIPRETGNAGGVSALFEL